MAYAHDQAMVIVLLAMTLFFLRSCGMYWTLPACYGREKASFLADALNFAGNMSGIVIS